MSKKLAEGIDALVLDVKVGSGAFMKTRDQARVLAQTMIGIGLAAGKKVTALLTEMEQPLGEAVGNSLEAIESADLLRGGGPARVRELTIRLSAEMLLSVGRVSTLAEAESLLASKLDNGEAWERWLRIVEAHGGDPRAVEDSSRMPQAPHRFVLKARESGVVTHFDCEGVGRASVMLGAGRARKEDSVDPAVGFMWKAHLGARVAAGDALAEIHWADEDRLKACVEMLERSVTIGDAATVPDLVLERVTTGL